MKKNNIILIGMPGAGKSTVAKYISQKLPGIILIDIDNEIETRNQKSISEIFNIYGEDYFRDIESEIAAEISQKNNLVISCGGGIILRKENIDNLKSNGYVFFIDRPLEKIIGSDLKDRPLIANDKGKLTETYKNRIDLYRKYADYIIDNQSSDVTADKIMLIYKELMDN